MSHFNPHLELTPHARWIPQNGRPLVIAGPCSAESEEQVLQTALEVR
jgi:chorismate mutase